MQLQAGDLQLYLKKDSGTRVLCEVCKRFQKNTFFIEHLRWLLLTFHFYIQSKHRHTSGFLTFSGWYKGSIDLHLAKMWHIFGHATIKKFCLIGWAMVCMFVVFHNNDPLISGLFKYIWPFSRYQVLKG